ncbi:MAG: efflux RND transporter periplasmic adaptor subunit [Pseudomonadota bacterium]
MPASETKTARPKRPSLLMRLVSGTVSFTLTLAVIGGAGIAVWQGSALLAERAAAAEPPEASPALPVEVRPVVMEESYRVERRFLGEVQAAQASDLSFELGGQIVELRVDEGQSVRQGDVIARLDTALLDTDTARLTAGRAALAADLDAAERRLVRQLELQQRGFSPEEALDQARATVDSLVARIAETDASIEAVAVRRDKALLRAPYDGQVAARLVDTGATVAGGAPVLRLLESDKVEIRVGVPSWVDVAPGTTWDVEIAGQRQTATVRALRPDIDPATRTRTALLQLDTVDVPFGTIASVHVPREIVEPGTWIPRTALREGAPGVWTVMVIDEEQRVRPAIVEILHAEADALYVRGGLSEGAPLITGGPHRIAPGQRVTPLGES